MVLVISQETFNNAVQENIQDFGLSPEEALREAVVQFESQGVDLSSIIKELIISPTNSENIDEKIVQLNELNKSKATSKQILEKLEAIKAECDKGIQYKVLAGQSGAYTALLDTFTKYVNDNEIRKNCMRTLISLMSKQPDLLDDRGIELIIASLKRDEDVDLKRLTLKWTKECCTMHEMNRQKIFAANILEKLKDLLDEGNSEILRETLGVCRALVLDDDVRVEFGKSHEHARIMASEILCCLTNLLSRFQENEQLICELMLTVCSLLVRTEFCKKVEDAGGLQIIKQVMKTFSSSEKVNRQCFKLLKALAGNDECKAHIIRNELAPVISEALESNKGNVPTVTAGLHCVAALSLRSPENSRALFDAGIAEVIVTVMKTQSDEKIILKTASWAMRNMVSRSQYQCKTFLELGAEDLLQMSLKKFQEIEYDLKAALRDLGCNVQLKEEWTGKGGALTTGFTKNES